MTATSTDRIEKNVQIEAPQSRVWRAITDYRQFGAWFGATLESPFVEGKTTLGRINIPGYEHIAMELAVETIEPETLFSYRWHPYAIDPNVDYSSEPTTLVEFRLSEAAGGTMLVVTESGFDALPAHRRDEAFRMDESGWSSQVRNIDKYVRGNP
jgi:uncharacterized protein YndB with AHSA1/START domain